MAEPIDIVIPILRGIQEDLASIKVEQRLHFSELRTSTAGIEKDVQVLKNRIIAVMGVDAERAYTIREHDEEIAEIKRRLDALEKTP